jgi:hypothetical protein
VLPAIGRLGGIVSLAGQAVGSSGDDLVGSGPAIDGRHRSGDLGRHGEAKELSGVGSAAPVDDDLGPPGAFQMPQQSSLGTSVSRTDDSDVTMGGHMIDMSQCRRRCDSKNPANAEIQHRSGHDCGFDPHGGNQ